MHHRFLLFAMIFPLLSGSGAAAQFSAQDFSRLSVLTGAWREPREGGMLYEVWEKAGDSLLNGRSFIISGRDTVPQETVQLSLHDGAITYSPRVEGQNDGRAVDFILRSISDSGFLFENPEHEFPQRIRYRVDGDRLLAVVSGSTKKGNRAIGYAYSRVPEHPCDGLGYFAGRWQLNAWATGTASGPPDISAVWILEKSREAGACFKGRVILGSADTFTREEIHYDSAGGIFIRTIYANDSSSYTLSTGGWQADRLIWLGAQIMPGGLRSEMKEEIIRKDKDAFSALFYVRRDGKWVLGMREELERVQTE